MLEGVDRPVAKVMMANLDLRHLMGIPVSATRGRGRKAPLLPFYEDIKAQHPTKVLLVRVRALPPLFPQQCLHRYHAHHRPQLLSAALTQGQQERRRLPRPYECKSARSALAPSLAPPLLYVRYCARWPCWQPRLLVPISRHARRIGPGKSGQVSHPHKASCASHVVSAHRWESSMRPWARTRWCWCSGRA